MTNKISIIYVTEATKERIKKLKKTQGESYENILLRLIERYGDTL